MIQIYPRFAQPIPQRRTSLAAYAFLSLCVLAASGTEEEPSYNGRTLSQWLAIEHAVARTVGPGLHRAPEEAVRAMGTNAIPKLLEWTSYQRSSAEREGQTEPTRPAPGTNQSPELTPLERARSTVFGFCVLGAAARPAIPQLTELARSSSDADRARRCAVSLAAIGPEAIPSILSLATNAPGATRSHAIGALEYMAGNPALASAVPVLIQCLGDTNWDNRISGEACDALSAIGLPGVVLPALTNALRSPNPDLRKQAAWCLAGFPEGASPVPAVTNTPPR